MNDTEADAQKERVQRYLDKWMPAGFGWWKLNIKYDRGDVVHELSHLLVGSIRDYSTDAQRQMTEFAVSCVTNALLWTHQNVK